MTAIGEISKLKDEINKMKKEKKETVKVINEKLSMLRSEIMDLYRLNYQLTCLKQSAFGEIQPDIVKFNDECFSGKDHDDYLKQFNDFKNEMSYFTIFKGKSNFLVLWLDKEQIEAHSKNNELIFKTPASFVEYISLFHKLRGMKGVENVNFYKCDIANVENVIKELGNGLDECSKQDAADSDDSDDAFN